MIDLLLKFDQHLLLKINSWNHPLLDWAMVFFSGQIIWIPFFLILLYFSFKSFPKRHFYLFCLFLIFAVIGSDVTSSYILKNIFNRLRPCRVLEIKEIMYYFGQRCGGKFGFVSSHAANSLSLILFSFLVLPRKFRTMNWIWIFPLIVGYSRVYLGAHYPGDILGGFLVGGLWGYVMSKLFQLKA